MLRPCVMEFKGNWDIYLPLMNFVHNNSYQASIEMAPYQALYGRKCKTPICQDEVNEQSLFGPNQFRILTRISWPKIDRRAMHCVNIYVFIMLILMITNKIKND